MATLRERILAKDDKKKELVFVPEWGENVWVRAISGRERDKYEEDSLQKQGNKRVVSLKDARAKLVVLAAVEEDGNALFTLADADALSQKSGAAVDRLYAVAAKLAGIRPEDEEEMAKNSALAQSVSSGSSSVTATPAQ